ncbi:MAG: UDP-glucose 4-epimerase GalE [Actinobacteria bacterium]|nr:UDP-glucose 4-epimerase GalE [Actinomycetota bacterium]MBW3651512.1 UDP-glucose 4-epimerase GalE [Actinomycetota bacterium]
MARTILLTGGAGYIGSHTVIELLNSGYRVVVVDDLSNSSRVALDRVAEVADGDLSFHEADVRDRAALAAVFAEHVPTAVIHFAGLKAVGESASDPLRYYEVNLGSTLSLLSVMSEHDVHELVFSSSATVYGDPASLPVREDAHVQPTNPYGRTKLFIEEILRDLADSDPSWRIALLRYFNPVGAHPSGRLGEDPNGVPNNLMPFVMQVAVGRLPEVQVFGDDYDTVDGTGVRDYIHVVDLANGHLAALEALPNSSGAHVINLGTGSGHSVLEVIDAAAEACGREIPYRVVGRRPGDVAAVYADPALAAEVLRWKASRTLKQMCEDSWRWQSRNPTGYRS